MLKFDPITLADWKSRNIHTISIEFVASGCEGTSIVIHEDTVLPGYTPMEHVDISVYTPSTQVSVLQDAYITKTGKKWIMKSESVLTRCGCGRSFGIATGDSRTDKIRLLKSKLSKSK
jgi:Fe-S cluster assembly iron-binding protein IscA